MHNSAIQMKEKLLTLHFCYILGANFLMFLGFYLLLPVFPFYLAETFLATNSTIGLVLSCYTVAAMFIRPFSGYMLDTFARKPLYILAYFLFMAIFAGYIVAGSLMMFTILRISHGIAFGTVSVAGNTIVIDILPSSRRGEGLGYYGLANNIAMSVGPMIGLFMHDSHCSYNTIFICSCTSCLIGLVLASLVSTPIKPPVERPPLSLDRFVLLSGIPAGITLLMLSIPYGITTSYIAMYSKQLGIDVSSGLFFSLMAVGIAVSRLFSGRLVDKGYMLHVIQISICFVAMVFLLLGFCTPLSHISTSFATGLFFACALMMGAGFGTMFPAYNSLFVSLAPNNRRGTAISTYLISWDLGIGSGLMIGGFVSQHIGFDAAYYIGSGLAIASAAIFALRVAQWNCAVKLFSK